MTPIQIKTSNFLKYPDALKRDYRPKRRRGAAAPGAMRVCSQMKPRLVYPFLTHHPNRVQLAISVSLLFIGNARPTEASWVDPDTPKIFHREGAYSPGDNREFNLVRRPQRNGPLVRVDSEVPVPKDTLLLLLPRGSFLCHYLRFCALCSNRNAPNVTFIPLHYSPYPGSCCDMGSKMFNIITAPS